MIIKILAILQDREKDLEFLVFRKFDRPEEHQGPLLVGIMQRLTTTRPSDAQATTKAAANIAWRGTGRLCL